MPSPANTKRRRSAPIVRDALPKGSVSLTKSNPLPRSYAHWSLEIFLSIRNGLILISQWTVWRTLGGILANSIMIVSFSILAVRLYTELVIKSLEQRVQSLHAATMQPPAADHCVFHTKSSKTGAHRRRSHRRIRYHCYHATPRTPPMHDPQPLIEKDDPVVPVISSETDHHKRKTIASDSQSSPEDSTESEPQERRSTPKLTQEVPIRQIGEALAGKLGNIRQSPCRSKYLDDNSISYRCNGGNDRIRLNTAATPKSLSPLRHQPLTNMRPEDPGGSIIHRSLRKPLIEATKASRTLY
ncbi:hypothetical protein F5Y06DRAFT_18030 [Hypoxylon sp. FL0890]|nr:hypothetical protein F5Y06DRAFT_18030 [Hypoxylon sp. FL0890]